MVTINQVNITPGSKRIDISQSRKPEHAFWQTKHNDKKIIAIWGLGNVAQYHASSLKKLKTNNFPNIKFIVFDKRPWDQNQENIKALAKEKITINPSDYHIADDALLKRIGNDLKVDAAVIGAPTLAHLEIMKTCSEKQIFVFDEKPIVLPWQLGHYSLLPESQREFIFPADFMKGSEALNFGISQEQGLLNEIGAITGVYSRFVENQTLDELANQFSTRAGLLKVKTSGGGIYLDMACHENIKLDSILKALFKGVGLGSAAIEETYLADAMGLNERLGISLKDPHAEIYGSVKYSLNDIPVYSDAGKGLGEDLKEWSFATHIQGSEGDLIISTGTIQRDPFIYIKKHNEPEGEIFEGFGDKFGYGPAFKDFFALLFGDKNAMQFPRAKWEETTFSSVAAASHVYKHAGTITGNGEAGNLQNMHYFNAGAFPEDAPKIWIPSNVESR